MLHEIIIPVLALLLISAALLLSSFRKAPGIGIGISVLLIVIYLILQKQGLGELGYHSPNWLTTILLGLLLGALIAILFTVLIEPLSDRITRSKIDLSVFSALRGNWKKTIMMIVVGWLLAAFLEESIFRGFILQRLAILFGDSWLAWLIAAVISSLLFGLAHWYQGKSGALTTGFVGLIFCAIFYFSGRSIWLAIFTHGFIDTVGLIMTGLGWDVKIKQRLWKQIP